MRNLILTSVIMMTVLLTACTNEEIVNYEYKFTGEGEYWKAEYLFEGTQTWGEEDGRTTYSNNNNDMFRLTYKGSIEEMKSIEKLEYSYETSAGGGGGTREFDEPPTDITFRTSGGGTGAKVNEDEIIPVIVKWEGFEESFELINETE